MNIKEKTFSELCKALNLKRAQISLGISIFAKCTFYETSFKEVYITDYNIKWNTENDIKEANIFTQKNCFYVFYENTYIVLSATILIDFNEFNKQIINFIQGVSLC